MAVTPAIDLSAGQRRTVLALLSRYLPNTAVWAYGSRVKWTSHPASDLDLVAFAKPDQAAGVAELREAFDDSDLPFRVDLFVWDDVPSGFRKRIEAEHVALTKREGSHRTAINEWPKVTLGTCASLVSDKVAPADSGDLPYIGLEHIGQGTLSLNGTGSARDVESTKAVFCAGDILFGKLRPYFRKVVRPRFDGICSTDIWVFRPKKDVDAGFLYYLLASSDFVRFASQGAEGTRMPRAKWEQASRFSVRLPPVSEQRAIAHILGALDDKIELNRRMIETTERVARTIFESWFRGRCSVSPNMARLDDLIDVNPAYHLGQGDTAPYLDMANTPTTTHTPHAITYRPYRSGTRFQNGDTLVARITPCLENGKAAYVDFLKEGEVGWGSTEFIVMRPKHPIPHEFAYCLARDENFRQFATLNMTGTSGRQRVSAESLAAFRLPVPSPTACRQFGQCARPLFSKARAAAFESLSLAGLRDTLLPKLIFGEIQLADAEEEIGAVV